MKKAKIRALVIEPMEHPKICSLEPTKKAFRMGVKADKIKHGGVEAKKLEKQIYAIFNKDRFLADLQANRRIGDDIIVGTMFIVATDEKGFPVSLTDEQMAKYALRFWNVEEFDEMDVAEANLNTMFSRFLTDEEW